jgi:hypothetical protein
VLLLLVSLFIFLFKGKHANVLTGPHTKLTARNLPAFGMISIVNAGMGKDTKAGWNLSFGLALRMELDGVTSSKRR